MKLNSYCIELLSLLVGMTLLTSPPACAKPVGVVGVITEGHAEARNWASESATVGRTFARGANVFILSRLRGYYVVDVVDNPGVDLFIRCDAVKPQGSVIIRPYAATSSQSPDGTSSAHLISIGGESYVEISSDRSGALSPINGRAYISDDEEQGDEIDHSEWTANSRFFVYTLDSSGGHQPWHHQTDIYDRVTNRFFTLDDYIGAVTDDFKLQGEDTLSTRVLVVGLQNESGDTTGKPVAIRLSRLGPKISK